MSDRPARAWTRPYDWAQVVLGVVAALTPIWADTDTTATWTMIVLGALIALDGLLVLAMPSLIYGEGVSAILGVLLFLAPWVMTYTQMEVAAWSSWIIGALTAIAGLAALPAANAMHRGRARPAH